MQNIKIATAQFEHKSGDKAYNLSVIDQMAKSAASKGAHAIAFHECSITGYTFARHLSKEQMLDLAEHIPGGESIKQLTDIARKYTSCSNPDVFIPVHVQCPNLVVTQAGRIVCTIPIVFEFAVFLVEQIQALERSYPHPIMIIHKQRSYRIVGKRSRIDAVLIMCEFLCFRIKTFQTPCQVTYPDYSGTIYRDTFNMI